MRFGGYTEKTWNYPGNINNYYKKDDKGICFCFSLDLFKIYNFNDNYNYSIYCYNESLPYFNTNEATFLSIQNNKGLLSGKTEYTTKNNSFGMFDTDFEINSGSKDFNIIELEVFQILFDN